MLWSVVTLVSLCTLVELLRRFVYNVNGRRDELRQRIAKQKEIVREFNPQTEYGAAMLWLLGIFFIFFIACFLDVARYIKADRELKKMQEELPLVGEAQVPTWLKAFAYAPYGFVLLHSVFYAPVLGVETDAEVYLHAKWWWPLSYFVSSPFLAAIIFTYITTRAVYILVNPQRTR